jgi:uncharacterized C2H2 Zn-finger protein
MRQFLAAVAHQDPKAALAAFDSLIQGEPIKCVRCGEIHRDSTSRLRSDVVVKLDEADLAKCWRCGWDLNRI